MTDLEVRQTIHTLARQIAVPYWHEKYTIDKTFQGDVSHGFPTKRQRIADMPIIRLQIVQSLPRDPDYIEGQDSKYIILTNKWNHRGLVCFVPEVYLGMAILSVTIVAVREKSVIAQPLEWIEVSPLLDTSYVGQEAQDIFDLYLEAVDGQVSRGLTGMESPSVEPDTRAIWHNKEIQL